MADEGSQRQQRRAAPRPTRPNRRDTHPSRSIAQSQVAQPGRTTGPMSATPAGSVAGSYVGPRTNMQEMNLVPCPQQIARCTRVRASRSDRRRRRHYRARAMTATLIDGKAIAQQVRARGSRGGRGVDASGHRAAGLATVLVGDDPASAVYVPGKQKACGGGRHRGLLARPARDTTQDEVEPLIADLGDDDRVSGILLQLPTPAADRRSAPDHADRPAARTSTG